MSSPLFPGAASGMKRPFAVLEESSVPSLAALGRLLNNLDAKAVTSAAASLVMLAVILVMVVFGQDLLGLDRQGVQRFLALANESPWSFPAVAVLFSALAMIGFPQAILFAGTVAVFGPWQGALFAWSATMISSAMTFSLGRLFGARWVRKISAGRAQTMIKVMQRRGLLASMVVRWTPSAPFIVVNAVCGAAAMPYWKFALGTGLGILPKLALIAFFTEQLDDLGRFLTSGDPSALLALAGLAAAWVAFFVFCRWLYRRLRNSSLAGLAAETTVTQNRSTLAGEQGQPS